MLRLACRAVTALAGRELRAMTDPNARLIVREILDLPHHAIRLERVMQVAGAHHSSPLLPQTLCIAAISAESGCTTSQRQKTSGQGAARRNGPRRAPDLAGDLEAVPMEQVMRVAGRPVAPLFSTCI